MPANESFPQINGFAPSWADVIFRTGPVAQDGTPRIQVATELIKSINTSSSLDVGRRMAGGRPMARTTGQASLEASVTFYREGFDQFLESLREEMPRRGNLYIYGLVTLNATLQFKLPTSNDLYVTLVQGCRILGRTLNTAEGTDASEVEVPLDPIEIIDQIGQNQYVLL